MGQLDLQCKKTSWKKVTPKGRLQGENIIALEKRVGQNNP
jgi:hypothetical protein